MNPKKITVALIIGGKSPEHKISLLSAKSVFAALNTAGYKVLIIGIHSSGEWHLYGKDYLENKDDPKTIFLNPYCREPLGLSLGTTGHFFHLKDRNFTPIEIDVVFPLIHGTFGEDGAIQGFLKILNIPFVGSDVLSSAVCMDKDYTKRLLQHAGIKVASYEAIKQGDTINLESLIERLGLPLFVKPASLGSSVGISKASNIAELQVAIQNSFQYEHKILVEQAIVGRELECAVLGNEDPKASEIGEIKNNCGFYSYTEKYLESDDDNLLIPASLPTEISDKVKDIAIHAFKILSCRGMARVDFFLTEAGELLVNEVNTIPGFTSISMYPSLWQESGKAIEELVSDLIIVALDHKENHRSPK